MKDYELTVMFHPDLEMNLEPALNKVKDLLDEVGGKISKESNEGKKRMAYVIKGQEFAVYYYYEVALPPEAPAKIASAFNITDEVIRYLLVTVDPRKLKMQAKREARKENNTDKEEE